MVAKTAAGVQGLSMMTLFPLTFLSNAFVPVDTLPGGLRRFANANPMSHLINAIRQLVEHGGAENDVWLTALGAVVILGIFAPLTVRAHMRRA